MFTVGRGALCLWRALLLQSHGTAHSPPKTISHLLTADHRQRWVCVHSLTSRSQGEQGMSNNNNNHWFIIQTLCTWKAPWRRSWECPTLGRVFMDSLVCSLTTWPVMRILFGISATQCLASECVNIKVKTLKSCFSNGNTLNDVFELQRGEFTMNTFRWPCFESIRRLLLGQVTMGALCLWTSSKSQQPTQDNMDHRHPATCWPIVWNLFFSLAVQGRPNPNHTG